MPLNPTFTVLLSVNGTVTSTSGSVRKFVNVFCYWTPTTLPLPTAANLAAKFDSTVWAALKSRLHTDWTGVSYSFRQPARQELPETVLALVPANGTRVGNRLPTHMCVNVALLSAVRGRFGLGLKRFGPISELDVLKDELTAAAMTPWNVTRARIGSALTDATGAVWTPAVASRQRSIPVPFPGIAWTEDVVATRINKTLGLARHRRERTVL